MQRVNICVYITLSVISSTDHAALGSKFTCFDLLWIYVLQIHNRFTTNGNEWSLSFDDLYFTVMVKAYNKSKSK